MKNDIINQINAFNKVYMQMLRYLVKSDDLINIKTSAVEEELEIGNENAFEKNFKLEIRDHLDPDSKYKDSLFFIPIVDKVKDLTQINKYIK